MEARQAWHILENSLTSMENGQGNWDFLVAEAQGAIALLLECPPEQVVAQIQVSRHPTKATMSWLVYEALKIKGVDRLKVDHLMAHWDRLTGKAAA